MLVIWNTYKNIRETHKLSKLYGNKRLIEDAFLLTIGETVCNDDIEIKTSNQGQMEIIVCNIR